MTPYLLKNRPRREEQRVTVSLALFASAALTASCGLQNASSQQGSSLPTDPKGQTLVVINGSENLQVCFDKFSTEAGQCSGAYRVSGGDIKAFTGGTCSHENLVETPDAAKPLTLTCVIKSEDGKQKSCLDEANIAEQVFAAPSLSTTDLGAGKWRSAGNPEKDYVSIVEAGTCQQHFAPPAQNAANEKNCQTTKLTQMGFALADEASAKCFPANDDEHPTDLACIVRNMALEIYTGVQFDQGTLQEIGEGALQPDRCYVTDQNSKDRVAWIVAKGSRGATPSTGEFLNYSYYTTTGEVTAAQSFVPGSTPINLQYDTARDAQNQIAGVITSEYIAMSGNWKTVEDETLGNNKVKTLVYQAGLYAVRWVPKTYCAGKYLRLGFPSASTSSTTSSASTQTEANKDSQNCPKP